MPVSNPGLTKLRHGCVSRHPCIQCLVDHNNNWYYVAWGAKPSLAICLGVPTDPSVYKVICIGVDLGMGQPEHVPRNNLETPMYSSVIVTFCPISMFWFPPIFVICLRHCTPVSMFVYLVVSDYQPWRQFCWLDVFLLVLSLSALPVCLYTYSPWLPFYTADCLFDCVNVFLLDQYTEWYRLRRRPIAWGQFLNVTAQRLCT